MFQTVVRQSDSEERWMCVHFGNFATTGYLVRV